MKCRVRRCIAVFLIIAVLCQLLGGCTNKDKSANRQNSQLSESVLYEKYLDEWDISEEKLESAYILENLVYEAGKYEYRLSENIISQAYIIEIVISETTAEDILQQLPTEIDDYEIDWERVIGKFAVGTAVIIVVGMVSHFASGSTYFLFGSPATVAKDAFVGGAIGVALNEVISCAKNGEVTQKAAKKYAIEGFSDGYMWGAISSVLKIFGNNFKRLASFKFANGNSAKIRVDGSVYDDAGKYIGKAYYNKDNTWYLWDDTTQVIRSFDAKGKELIGNAALDMQGLPANSKFRLGVDTSAKVCYTDDSGQIMRIGNELLPNIDYSVNDYLYRTDEYGRLTSVVFDDLQLKSPGRPRFDITDTKSTIGHGFEKVTDDRGHLMADMFNGDNTLANIVAMDGNVNKGEVKMIETIWQNCLQDGGNVSGTIELSYNGSSFRPSSFNYSYDVGDGLVSRVISNG